MTQLRTVALSVMLGLVGAVVVFAVTYLSPLGQPRIEMQVMSSTPGFSQLFVADPDQVFSESRSTWQPVVGGYSTVGFPLKEWRGTVGTHFRWDPLDQPGLMNVMSVALKSFLREQTIDMSAIRASMSMGEVVVGPGGAELDLQSNDAQALIDIDPSGFVRSSLITAMVVSLLVGVLLAAVAGLFLRRQRKRPEHAAGDRWAVRNVLAVPRVVDAVLFGILGIALVILWRGAALIGVSWDEPIHEASLAEYFRSGVFVPRYAIAGGIPTIADASVYAPVGALWAHAMGVVSGAHAWAESSLSASAWSSRHNATAVLAALTVGVVAVLGRLVLGRWSWGLLASATLASIPLFVGHGMFNIKDVPVAAGFSLVTLGLVLLAGQTFRLRRDSCAFLAIAAGVLLSIGNRPGVWIALALSVFASLLAYLVADLLGSSARVALVHFGRRSGVIAASLLTAGLILWVTYPYAFGEPWGLLRNSLAASQSFPWFGQTLTAGQYMPAQPPWTYVPLWLGAQLPILITLMALVGLVTIIVAYAQSLARVGDRRGSGYTGIPIVLQALSVPLGVVVLGATLYGGVRQLLFILPAVAVLAAVGVHWLALRVSHSSRRWLTSALWVVVIIGLVIPTISQVRLFPYSFAYFNSIAASRDINGNWDVDGWWLSARELVEEKTLPTRVVCAESPPRPLVDCEQLGVVAPYLPASADPMGQGAPDGYTLLTRYETPLAKDVCRTVGGVSRPLFWQEVRLSSIEECTATLNQYPTGGIVFAGAQRPDAQVLWGWNPYLLWGWGAPEAEGVWTSSSEAAVGFVDSEIVDSPERQRTLSLNGRFDVPDGEQRPVGVLVNGQQVGGVLARSAPDPQSWTFTVSPAVLEGLGRGRVIVQFTGLDDLADDESTGVTGARLRLDSLSLV